MSTFKALYRFCATITSGLAEIGSVLELSETDKTDLVLELGTDGFTRLVAHTPSGYAQVVVEFDGEDIVVTEFIPTNATISGGTELFFDWTPENWLSMNKCVNTADDSEAASLADMIKSDTLNVAVVAGKVCIEPKNDNEAVWESCGYRYTDKSGMVQMEPIDNAQADGDFNPARVVVVDGKPTYSQSTCTILEKPTTCDPCISKGT